MRQFFKITALATAMTGPAFADTIGEETRFKINRINVSDFEVIQIQGMAAAEFWCAAASHTIRRQGRPSGTPIYLKRPLGPSVTVPAARSVVFSYSPDRLSPTSLPVWSITQIGAVSKSGKALRMCRDAFTRSTK
jgi:hypothetical protein